MRQSDHEYEERSFGDIQRAIDFENSMNDLESQLYYQHLSPKEVAQQVLKATCQFYDADWCGLIQVDLDLNLWTPFWWFNAGATDKTMLLTEEYESAEFLDRWVQTVRKGIPMVVSDAEATKEAYPAEYNLYQRLGIRSVIAVSLEPRPVALLAVRNPKAAQPTHCLVEPEKLEPSIVQAEQIFTIDKSRVQNFVGHLTPEEMSRVDDAVKISLALNPMGSIQKLKPIIRSAAAYAPPEVVDGKPPVYPYTPIKSDFEDAETVEEMMLYTELQSAVHAMIQRLEYSFTFNPTLLTIPKRKQQVAEILEEAEKYIWRIKEEMRCA
mgnify:CR=1 FL=1